jgi:hypothetical protein
VGTGNLFYVASPYSAPLVFYMIFQDEQAYGCFSRVTALRINNTKMPSIPPKTSDKANIRLVFVLLLNSMADKS